MSNLYFCPTVGEIESESGGGFRNCTCCEHPELHTYLGRRTAGIDAISDWLSEKAKTDFKNSQRLEAVEERLRVAAQALADDGYFTPEQIGEDIAPRIIEWSAHHRQGRLWAETIHTDDDGRLRIPVYAEDGSEREAVIVKDRFDAVTLHAMIADYIGECPSECDDDCDMACHEAHAVPWKRHHPVGEHKEEGTTP